MGLGTGRYLSYAFIHRMISLVLLMRGGSSSSECHCARNHGNFGLAHTLKLRLRDSAGALEEHRILGVASDFTGELVQLFCKCRA
jgi:hypothetical protein